MRVPTVHRFLWRCASARFPRTVISTPNIDYYSKFQLIDHPQTHTRPNKNTFQHLLGWDLVIWKPAGTLLSNKCCGIAETARTVK